MITFQTNSATFRFRLFTEIIPNMKPCLDVDKVTLEKDDTGYSLLGWFLDRLLPGGQGYVAMMEAYFDESGTQGNAAALFVAGYLFEAEDARAFERDLHSLLCPLNITTFHAFECYARSGEFQGMGRFPWDQCHGSGWWWWWWWKRVIGWWFGGCGAWSR